MDNLLFWLLLLSVAVLSYKIGKVSNEVKNQGNQLKKLKESIIDSKYKKEKK